MISQHRAEEKPQVLTGHQWQTVREEERQNQQLLNLSDQILELTKAIHEQLQCGKRDQEPVWSGHLGHAEGR